MELMRQCLKSILEKLYRFISDQIDQIEVYSLYARMKIPNKFQLHCLIILT